MTCKDCLHYEVCDKKWIYTMYINGERNNLCGVEDRCNDFKDKSKWVHLPLKVGDTVYVPWSYDGIEGVAFSEVEEIRIYGKFPVLIVVRNFESDMDMPTGFYSENLGKTFFLTREEAEKALVEREEK